MTVSVKLPLPPSTVPSGAALSRATPSLAASPASDEPPSPASPPASTEPPEVALPEAPEPAPEELPLTPEAPLLAPDVPLAVPLPDALPVVAPEVPEEALGVLFEPQPSVGAPMQATRTRRLLGRTTVNR